MRHLFGLEEGAFIAGVVAEDAVRKTSADIDEHLHALMPTF